MFTNAKSIRTQPPAHPRGLATFRVYLSIIGRTPGIYQEAVLGAYRHGNGETVVVLRGNGDRQHAYTLNPKAGYAQILGDLSEVVRPPYELAGLGENFFVHSERLKKLDRDEIVAAVFAMPVWYGGYSAEPDHDKAPRIPFSAKMFRRSALVSPIEMMQQQLSRTPGYSPDMFQEQDDSSEEMGMR